MAVWLFRAGLAAFIIWWTPWDSSEHQDCYFDTRDGIQAVYCD